MRAVAIYQQLDDIIPNESHPTGFQGDLFQLRLAALAGQLALRIADGSRLQVRWSFHRRLGPR